MVLVVGVDMGYPGTNEVSPVMGRRALALVRQVGVCLTVADVVAARMALRFAGEVPDFAARYHYAHEDVKAARDELALMAAEVHRYLRSDRLEIPAGDGGEDLAAGLGAMELLEAVEDTRRIAGPLADSGPPGAGVVMGAVESLAECAELLREHSVTAGLDEDGGRSS